MSNLPQNLTAEMQFAWPKLAGLMAHIGALLEAFLIAGTRLLPARLARRAAREMVRAETLLRALITLRAVELAGELPDPETAPAPAAPGTMAKQPPRAAAPTGARGFALFEPARPWQPFPEDAFSSAAMRTHLPAVGLLARLAALKAAEARAEVLAARLARRARLRRAFLALPLSQREAAARPRGRALPFSLRALAAPPPDPGDITASLALELRGAAIRALDRYLMSLPAA